jgi:L-seryl-tRNA(Ser) seleniumtransferase
MTQTSERPNPYRGLPAIDRLLADAQVAPLAERHGHDAIVRIARAVLDEYRAEIERAGAPPARSPAEAVAERAEALEPSLRRVVNATGVVIHTNLGRAPLSAAAIEAMAAASEGYSNLEFDLDGGARGSRFSHLSELLARVTGAEAGIAVNNNASALLLALSALCAESEVVISRGQLVEIGGGFRIPDVMRQSGARLVEVGTTNRTYLRDYAEAIGDDTAALLRVHASNFRVVGFTEEAPLEGLAALARERGLLLIDDLGSGALLDTREHGLAAEPTVQASVAAGADVTLFSGDKLIGGPQAGIAVGTEATLEVMQRHPLARAMRMDKASIAGLAATLGHYARGEAVEAIPVWRMIAAPLDELRRRASGWADACGDGAAAEVVAGRSMIGGGSLPEEGLDTALCAIAAPPGGADALTAALRSASLPIVARIEHDRVLLDPRTVEPADDAHVAATLREATAATRDASAGAAGYSPGR